MHPDFCLKFYKLNAYPTCKTFTRTRPVPTSTGQSGIPVGTGRPAHL